MKLAILNKEFSIKDSINLIKSSGISIGLVIENERLIGVLTQGDIIKHIVNENSIFGKVNDLMTIDYRYELSKDRNKLLNIHNKEKIPYIPIVTQEKKLIGLSSIYEKDIIVYVY